MFELIRAHAEDAPLVCRIGAETFEKAFRAHNSKEDMESYLSRAFALPAIEAELNDPKSAYFLCYEQGKCIGYLKLNYFKTCPFIASENTAELQRIYLLPEAYGGGAGKFMMDFAVTHCHDKGFESLWLGVWKENYRAIAMYRKNGFEVIGERPFQVGSRQFEDYYMMRSL